MNCNLSAGRTPRRCPARASFKGDGDKMKKPLAWLSMANRERVCLRMPNAIQVGR